MGHKEKKQYFQYGSCRKRRGRKGTEIICKEIMPENFLSLERIGHPFL